MRHIRISMPAAAAVLTAAVLFFAAGSPALDTAPQSPVAASVANQELAPGSRGSAYVSTHLYFGTGRHNGNPPITEAQFDKFVTDVITPASRPASPSRRPAASGGTRRATSTGRSPTS